MRHRSGHTRSPDCSGTPAPLLSTCWLTAAPLLLPAVCQSLVNESFLPHFTLFADTMRELGYAHYVHNQPLASPTVDHSTPQPVDQAIHHTSLAVPADSNGVSEGQIDQPGIEIAVVPG